MIYYIACKISKLYVLKCLCHKNMTKINKLTSSDV